MATTPVEDFSAQDKIDFRAAIGAGTPATTESVLALLADADIEVASIGIIDGTGTQLDAGRLTLNAAGDVVVHDGESNTEDLPHLVNSRESLNFATRVIAASMNNVTFSRKLADINLPESFITNGKILHFFGDTFVAWSAGNKPNFETRLVLCKEGTDPTTSGIHFFIGMGAWSETIRFHLSFVFSVTDGVSTLNTEFTRPAGISTYNDDGVITQAASIHDGSEYFLESIITGLVGEPLKLELYLFTKDTTDTVTANLAASGSVSVISQ